MRRVAQSFFTEVHRGEQDFVKCTKTITSLLLNDKIGTIVLLLHIAE